eukprot:Phypoly_transcript_07204.p1 GENE.Phypoly_transcript_07204~~Phypoly_transcript_07204.p1  ORF type:complete len:451 (+),score=100.14 Phypoly_transcript_07204:16-1368(+)
MVSRQEVGYCCSSHEEQKGNQRQVLIISPMQALHTKKLEQGLRSNERFPINLEWMVDVFKYKHISSLTTHLKRHFKINVHYKRFAQEQNKRVWTYFITVDCFIGICEYVRHAARKKIANVWLRKVGVKGAARRAPRDFEEEVFSEEEEMMDDGVDEEDEEEEREEGEDREDEGDMYEYYEQSPRKRRRITDDEEYKCDEEEDEEERAYFQEMEEEEACANYDTDDSADYESSSDSASFGALTEPALRAHNENVNSNFRIIYSSSESSDSLCSSNDSVSPPSTPTSPMSERAFPSSPLPATPATVSPQPPRAQNAPTFKAETETAPTEMCKEQVDWSYLHLRPNPHPLGNAYDFPAKYFASLMFGPQYFSYPQVQPNTYMVAPGAFLSNYHAMHFPNTVDPNGLSVRPARHDTDNLHCHVDMSNKDERHFDTNMFLSFPDEHHFQFPLTRD